MACGTAPPGGAAWQNGSVIRATTLQRNNAHRSTATGVRGKASGIAGRLAVAIVLLPALAACTAAGDQATVGQPAGSGQAAPATTAASAKPSASAAAPGALASSAPAAGSGASAGSTAALQRTITDVLGSVIKANAKPAQADITAALTAAGVPAKNLEVSAGRTPTGLEVDSMEAAAVQGKECVVGQIREGKVAVTVLPALSNGKCFVGAPA